MASTIRVLVVDDNHLIRRLLDLILEGAGYVPVEAESGAVALEAARSDPPDLCLVDEAMPGMSGADLIRILRASADPRLASVPVIGISGRDGAERELLGAGASAFVRKPLDERALLGVIGRVLAQRHPGGDPPRVPAA